MQLNWKVTPIVGIYGKKGSGKSVFAEGSATSIFTKEDGEVINKTDLKLIDLWNFSSIGRFEGIYFSFPAKRVYALQRARLGLKSFGIPTNVLIPHSLNVPRLLPMNPQTFIDERPDLPEAFKNIDMNFKVVTLPFKDMEGAELCMRYGRRETELSVAMTDVEIQRAEDNDTAIHLADNLRKSLSGIRKTPLTNLKSKSLNRFLMKELADMRSRRSVVNMIKPLIEEKMLMSKNFRFNLDWQKEIEEKDRISVLYQGFLDRGNALMVTYHSMRKIIEICIENGLKVIFLVREITDIAPAYPNPLYPQLQFGSFLMEQIARQLRGRVALVYDTQRQHLLIDSLKTQSDINVFFNSQGQDLVEANRRLQPAFGIDFEKGTSKHPPLNRLEVGQCYIWDTTKMKLYFVRRVLMPCHRHWDSERSFIQHWQSKGYPMKTWTIIEQAIEEELRKADEELYEQERERKQVDDERTAKSRREAEIEEEKTVNEVLRLTEIVNPNTGKLYSIRGIVEKFREEGLEITRDRVSKILKRMRKMSV